MNGYKGFVLIFATILYSLGAKIWDLVFKP